MRGRQDWVAFSAVGHDVISESDCVDRQVGANGASGWRLVVPPLDRGAIGGMVSSSLPYHVGARGGDWLTYPNGFSPRTDQDPRELSRKPQQRRRRCDLGTRSRETSPGVVVFFTSLFVPVHEPC